MGGLPYTLHADMVTTSCRHFLFLLVQMRTSWTMTAQEAGCNTRMGSRLKVPRWP